MRRDDKATRAAAVFAVATHVLALGAIGKYARPFPHAQAARATPLAEVAELSVGVDDVVEAAQPAAARPGGSLRTTTVRTLRRASSLRMDDASAAEPTVVTTRSPSHAAETWSPSFLPPAPVATVANADLARGAAWLPSRDTPPETTTAAEASVRDAVNAGDRAFGMSPGAPLKELAHVSVRQSRAPTTGRARIEVRTDREGAVVAVRVLDAKGDRDGWDDAARAIAEAARGRRLHVPADAAGLSVMLDVASYMTTASGVSRGESKVHVASPMGTGGTGDVKASPAPQPLRFNLIVGPNQVDARVHLGVGDIAHDASHPDRRTITVEIAEERGF